MWAFMPPEFYGNVKRIYDNSVPVWYKGTLSTNALPKPYGMDGAVVGFKGTISGNQKTYIYAAMRRGGRSLYAFDVTTAASPTLLWKIGCSSGDLTSTDCGSGNWNYSSIGQTWAAPKVFFAAAYNNGTTPLLLMGGGYDTCEDTDTGTGGANNNCTGTPKGSIVYIIDGTDGHIVQSFDTVAPYSGGAPRSVVGEPTIVANNGIANYAYIADLGGVVYRLDFTGSNVSNWSMTTIAKLGCDTLSACSANRKFMFQPSVVSTDGITFDVLLGTGDREKPTTQYGASNGVQDYFFMVQDQPSSNSYLNGQCGAGNNFICLSALTPITLTSGSPSATTLASSRGWSLQLSSTEQVVTSAITQFGVTSFSTHQPAQANVSCTPTLGVSRVYNVSYKDASAVNGTALYARLAGDGLPPSPVAGNVLINGSSIPFCIGCSADSPLQGKKATQISSVARAKSRLFWYLEKN
jgi:type IV pilus assembly protein PilY1